MASQSFPFIERQNLGFHAYLQETVTPFLKSGIIIGDILPVTNPVFYMEASSLGMIICIVIKIHIGIMDKEQLKIKFIFWL